MIRLEAFTASDYDRLIGWIDGPEILMQFSGPVFRFPLTRAQLDQNASDPARVSYNVVDTGKEHVIGHCELYYRPASILIGRILIGEPEARGKGTGGEIIRALVSIASEDPDQRLIELNVFDWNHAAIRCYEREGFELNPSVKYEREIGGEIWTALNMVYVR